MNFIWRNFFWRTSFSVTSFAKLNLAKLDCPNPFPGFARFSTGYARQITSFFWTKLFFLPNFFGKTFYYVKLWQTSFAENFIHLHFLCVNPFPGFDRFSTGYARQTTTQTLTPKFFLTKLFFLFGGTF